MTSVEFRPIIIDLVSRKLLKNNIFQYTRSKHFVFPSAPTMRAPRGTTIRVINLSLVKTVVSKSSCTNP